MQVCILGPLVARDAAGRDLDVAGTRLRLLLARLALEPGRAVTAGALVESVWQQELPADPANALQALVSRLRRVVGAQAVEQVAGGYRLAIDPDDVDSVRFERLHAAAAAASAAGDTARAAELLDEGLALWRGPALADVPAAPGGALAADARRLDERRLAAVVERAAARQAAGVPVDLAELRQLAADNPLHEPLHAAMLRALAADGRRGEALQEYERLRARLADELGTDPAEEVQQLHLALLRGGSARTAGARSNLRAPLTSFVGRDDDVARVVKALDQSRLVTLVGPGGAGKTRLATEAAAALLDAVPDGVWLAELAAITSEDDVAQAVLTSVGLREIQLLDQRRTGRPRDAAGRLREGLADKQAILLLDNCEHLLDAAARLADQLLGDCPGLRVLATSRESLGLTGEQLVPVLPLASPSDAQTAPPRQVTDYPAVRLFADRAASVRVDFRVDERTAAPVVEIVRRLDGLPLAIELAAARLRSMPVDEIAARLSDRFRLLTGGSRTALPRHRTLRAVVDWSWDLLNDVERDAAERLAVFPAGITAASAAAVLSGEGEAVDVSDVLGSLVDKSLLQPVGDGRRFRMLETIREYAAEQLANRGGLMAARARHASHFADLLHRATPHLTTADQLPWLAELNAERDNILAALRFRIDTGEADAALAMQLEIGVWTMLLGDYSDAAEPLRDALALPAGADTESRLLAGALLALSTAAAGQQPADVDLGEVARSLADIDITRRPIFAVLRPALAFFAGEEALVGRYLDEAIDNGDQWGRAAALMFRASIAENTGDVETMRRDNELALAAFRRIGERWGLASALRGRAQVRALDGDLSGAVTAYEEALGLLAELGSSDDAVMIHGQLADLALRAGDLAAARRYAEAARRSAEAIGTSVELLLADTMVAAVEEQLGELDSARERSDAALARLAQLPDGLFGYGQMRAMTLTIAGHVRLSAGRADEAEHLARQAFTLAVPLQDRPVIATVGVLIARLTAAAGRAADAARLLGAAARLRGADDATAWHVATLTDTVRELIGPAAFADEYRRGGELDFAAALAQLDPATALA